MDNFKIYELTSVYENNTPYFLRNLITDYQNELDSYQEAISNRQKGEVVSASGQHSPFTYTYNESFSITQNAQKTLSFSMNKYISRANEWHENPFTNKIQVGSLLLLQDRFNNEYFFTVKEIKYDIKENNIIFNYTCQDSFSYQNSRQNMGYTLENDASSKDFIGALTLDDWVINYIQPECGITYTYLKLNEGLYQGTDGNIYSFNAGNELKDVDHIIKEAYQPALYDENGKIKDKRDDDYFETIPFSCSNSNASAALIALADQIDFQLVTFEREKTPGSNEFHQFFWFEPKKNDRRVGLTYDPNTSIKSFGLSHKGESLTTILNVSGPTYNDEIITLLPELPPFFFRYFNSKEWETTTYYPGLFSRLCQNKVLEYKDNNNSEYYFNVGQFRNDVEGFNHNNSFYDEGKLYIQCYNNVDEETYYFQVPRMYDSIESYYFDTEANKNKYSFITVTTINNTNSKDFNSQLTDFSYVLFDIDSSETIYFSSRDKMPSLKDGHKYKLFIEIVMEAILEFSIDELILNFNRSASQEEIDFATIADNCPWLENKLIDFSYFYENGLLSENEYKTIRKILMNDLRIINGKLMIYTQSYYNALSEKTKELAKLNESLDTIGVTCQADVLEPLKEGKKINFNDLSSLRTLYNGFFTEPESKTGLLNYGSVLSEYFNDYISAEQRFLKNIYNFKEIFNARNTYQNEALYQYNFSIVDDSHISPNEQHFYCFNENKLFTIINGDNFNDEIKWNSDTGECWTSIYQSDDAGKTFSPVIIADLNKFNNNELYILDLEAFEDLNESEPYNNNVYYKVNNEIKDKKYFIKDYSIKVGYYREDLYSLFYDANLPTASPFISAHDSISIYVKDDKREDLFLDIYGYTPEQTPYKDYLLNIPLSELYVANQGDYQVIYNGKEYEFLRKNKEGKTQKDYVQYLEWISNPDDSIRKEILNPYDYKTYISIPFVNYNNQHSFYHWYNPTWGIIWDTERINELKEITSASDRLEKAAAWYEFTTEGIPYIDIFAEDWNFGNAVVFASGSNSISNYLNWKKQHINYSQSISIETTGAIIKRENDTYIKDTVFNNVWPHRDEFPNSTTEAYALFWKLFGTMHNAAEHHQNLYFKDILLKPLSGLDAEIDDNHQYRILVLKDPFNSSADWNNLDSISAITYYYIYKKLIGLDLSESLRDKHITTVRDIFPNAQANGKIYSIDDTKFLIFKLIDYKLVNNKPIKIDETNYDPTRTVYDKNGRKIDFDTALIVPKITYESQQVSKTSKEKVYQLATIWESTNIYFIKLNEDIYSRAYTCQNIIDNENTNIRFYAANATKLTQYFFEPNKEFITLPLYKITYKKDENNLLSARTSELMSIDDIQFNYDEDPSSALITIGEDTIQINLEVTLEEEISGLNNGTFWFKYHNRLDFPVLFEHAAAIEAQLNQYWIQAYGASKYCKFFLPEHWTPEADQTPNYFADLVIIPEIEDDVKSVYLSSKYIPQVKLIREGSKTRFTKYYFEYQNDDWDKNSIVLNNLTYSDTAAIQHQKLQNEINNNEALGQIFEYLQEDIKNWEVKENGVTSYYLYQSGGTTWAQFLEEIIGSKEFDNFGGIYDLGFKRLKLAYQGKDFREYERYKELHKNKWNLLRSVYGYLLLENDYKNTTATNSIDLLKMAKYAFKDYMNPERAYSISIIDAAKLGGYKNQEIRVGDAIKIDASSYYNEYDQIYKSLSQLLFITDIKYTLRNPTDISVTVNNIKYSDKLIQRLAKLVK